MTKDPRLPLSLGVEIRRPRPATDVVPNIARNPPALAIIDHFADADTALHQLTGRPLRGLAVVVGNGDVAPLVMCVTNVRSSHGELLCTFFTWRAMASSDTTEMRITPCASASG